MALYADTRSLNVLSICSGGGGLDLGLKISEPRARTVCYVEREAYAAATLVGRMEDSSLDRAPIWDDITTFDGRAWRGIVDGIAGGYPCQGESSAGLRRGIADERWIWPKIARRIDEIEPGFCFFENVGAHLSRSFIHVLGDLQGMGFRVAAGLFTAREVGGSHERERLFILAHGPNFCSEWGGKSKQSYRPGELSAGGHGVGQADTESGGWLQAIGRIEERQQPDTDGASMADTGHEPGRPVQQITARKTGFAPYDRICGEELANSDGLGFSRVGRGGEIGTSQYCCETMADARCDGFERRQEYDVGSIGSQQSAPFRHHAEQCDQGLANSGCSGLSNPQQPGQPGQAQQRFESRSTTDELRGTLPLAAPGPSDSRWPEIIRLDPTIEPSLCRVAHGVAHRVDRLRLTGNGVYPLAAALAHRTLSLALTDGRELRSADQLIRGRMI